MKEHYEAVLRDMGEQERKLEAQLAKIRAARPAIQAMMDDAAPKPMQGPPLFKYSAMGPKEAMVALFADVNCPLQAHEIETRLREGGVKTSSSDFASVVKSTLANLKKEGAVERVEEGWRLTPHRRPADSLAPWQANAQRQPLRQ